MKKILHISKFYTPYYGGIEDVVNNIVNTLKGSYDQQVICFNNQPKHSKEIVDGIEVTRVGILGTVFSQPISYGYWYSLLHTIRTFRPDYIHIHLPNPLICLLLLMTPRYGAKIVVHWHADILNNRLYRLCRGIERIILQKAYAIIATSKEYVEGSIPLQPFKQKIIILPNTIAANKIITPTAKERDELRANYSQKKIVFAVGRHVAYKGFNYLIEASKYLDKGVAVVIAGTGPETQHLKQLAVGLPNIYFLGRISNEQLSLYLHSADVFAFPSIDRREAFGVALAEALYCGIPAVSFAIKGSGVTWVNKDGYTGIVVPQFSAQLYATALNKLLNDDVLRATYSHNAKEWIQTHFMADQINILRKVYE